MQLLALLMPLLGLVAFVGFAWLLVVAFRQSALWGIGVLLLSPITAIIFAIRYWQESKKPFLVYSGSSLAGLVIMATMFNSLGGFEMLGMARRLQQGEPISDEETMAFMQVTMDRMESSGLLSEKEKADLEQMRQEFDKLGAESEAANGDQQVTTTTRSATATTSGSAAENEPEEKTVRKTETVAKRGPRPSPTGHIAVRDARHFVGAQVRVIDHNGHERHGTISEAGPSAIVLTKYLHGGTFTYEVRTSEVASLQVLRD